METAVPVAVAGLSEEKSQPVQAVRASAALRALSQVSSAGALASQVIAHAARATRDIAVDPGSLGLRIRAKLAQRAVKRSVERFEARRIADEWQEYVDNAQSGLAPWQMHGMQAHPDEMTAAFQAPRARSLATDAEDPIAPLPAGTGLRDRTRQAEQVSAAAATTATAWQGFPSELVHGPSHPVESSDLVTLRAAKPMLRPKW